MTLRLAGPLLLVGAGKMGGALLEGWLRQGLDPATVFVQDPAPPPEVQALAARHRMAVSDAPDLPAPPSVIVLAVKPDLVEKLLPEIEPLMGEGSVVLSIAAGRTLVSLSRNLPPGTPIVRAMPNVAASIGRSMTAACANSAVTRDQALECTMLLEAIGDVMWIDDESLLDAITAVSGSGPGLCLSARRVSRRSRPCRRSRCRACEPFGAGDGRGRGRVVTALGPFAARAQGEGDLAPRDHRGGTPGAHGQGWGRRTFSPAPSPPPPSAPANCRRSAPSRHGQSRLGDRPEARAFR